MQNDILFDNIYIGHSVEDAEKLKEETWDVKHAIEVAEEEASKPKPDSKPKSPNDLVFMDDPVFYIREKLDLFLTIAKQDPIQAIKFVPEIAGGLGVIVVTMVAIIVAAIGMSSSSPPPDVKKAAEKIKEAASDAKDKVSDASASGAEAVKSEVNKRTTRSTASE